MVVNGGAVRSALLTTVSDVVVYCAHILIAPCSVSCHAGVLSTHNTVRHIQPQWYRAWRNESYIHILPRTTSAIMSRPSTCQRVDWKCSTGKWRTKIEQKMSVQDRKMRDRIKYWNKYTLMCTYVYRVKLNIINVAYIAISTILKRHLFCKSQCSKNVFNARTAADKWVN